MAKVTIHEVARAVGVSTSTVSRALNGRYGVNSDTRTQVLALAEQLGFVPDPGARRLARNREHMIGLAPNVDTQPYNPYQFILQEALHEAFSDEGYRTRVLEPGPDGLPTEAADGLVLLEVHLGDPRPTLLRARQTPFVLVGQAVQHASWVDIDNATGIRAAVEHLVSLGHRRIAHLSGANLGQVSLQRRSAYRGALERAGLPADPRLILDGGFTALGGYRAVREALGQGLEFTALAAASDEMALGAVVALGDAGLRVPGDVSVTGFDDLPIAARGDPPLTTVRQPIREVGFRAAALLLERLAGEAPRHELLPVELVVRGSTAPPPDSS